MIFYCAANRSSVDLVAIRDAGEILPVYNDGLDNSVAFGRSQGRRASDVLSLLLHRLHSGPRALADERPLKFGQCGHHVEDEATACGTGVYVLGKRLKFDTFLRKIVDQLDEMKQGPAQAIKAPHH